MKAKQDKLDAILESRLGMQSVQTYLDGYHIPADSKFLKSKRFYNNYFSKWPEYRKRNFLMKIVGPFYWKRMQQILEK